MDIEEVIRVAREVQFEKAVELFKQGVGITEISRRVGLPRTSIYDHLARVGLRTPQKGVFGVPPLAECQRGHDMAKYRKPLSHGRGWYCGECKRISDREAYHAKKNKQ